jgi:hypothetical protein
VSHPIEVSHPASTYGLPGQGGRQPVAFVGDRPRRRTRKELGERRRPVVAILDTGCGQHPWLDSVVRTDVKVAGRPIGYTDDETNPELNPDQAGPIDGSIDPISGHGTFIAGIIHQACPDADILSWRVVPSNGPLVESDWIAALSQIFELVSRHAEGRPGGRMIDVLSLSMGYYHETPDDHLFDPELKHILTELGRLGVIVVCSAGNDATSRPSFPAAFAPWAGARRKPAEDVVPIVSVGAQNPNLRTDAMFSNAGPWVRTWVPGAAVVSTIPAFEGGLLPLARTVDDEGRLRECIDPDDFRGGFAVWSGTSFAAPLLAGRLASALAPRLPKRSAPAQRPSVVVARAWKVVEELTPIRR